MMLLSIGHDRSLWGTANTASTRKTISSTLILTPRPRTLAKAIRHHVIAGHDRRDLYSGQIPAAEAT